MHLLQPDLKRSSFYRGFQERDVLSTVVPGVRAGGAYLQESPGVE